MPTEKVDEVRVSKRLCTRTRRSDGGQTLAARQVISSRRRPSCHGVACEISQFPPLPVGHMPFPVPQTVYPVRFGHFYSRMISPQAEADGDVAARVLASGLMLLLIWQLHATSVKAIVLDETRLIDSSIEQFLAALRPAGSEHRKANVHI